MIYLLLVGIFHLCGKITSNTGAGEVLGNYAESDMTGNPKMLSAICAMLHGRHYCVNEWKVHVQSTAQTTTKHEGEYTVDCMF